MNLTVDEAVNKYYSLKAEYEKTISDSKLYSKPLKGGLSIKERRKVYLKKKHKCVNCKRPVGSKFTTSLNEMGERSLIALCGDVTSPCPLNINIYLESTADFRDEMDESEKEINDLKKKIILDKNNLIFGYITSEQAVENFDKIKEDLSSKIKTYESLKEFVIDITDDIENVDSLKKKENLLDDTIFQFKKMVGDFEKTKDVQYIQDLVEIYINKLLPVIKYDDRGNPKKINNLLKNIMTEKYSYIAVEKNELDEDGVYKLIQIPHTIQDFEFAGSGENSGKVVSFRIGL